ncbi:MAG: AAA family ATPase [Solirubrobacterales bacterium]|nr:AAA family ATPase [Solirubrobacterales bacterium]
MSKTSDRPLDFDSLGFVAELRVYSSGLFTATHNERGFSRIRNRTKSIGEVKRGELAGLLGDPAFASVTPQGEAAIVDHGDVLVSVSISDNHASVVAAGFDGERLEEEIDAVLALLPEPEPRHLSTNVRFWSESLGSANRMEAGLSPRRWDELAAGYAHETREALGDLMTHDSLPSGGRLILWHGEPGTGKTNALRALAHQWRVWCELDYITDPAMFISGKMSYLLDVLSSGSDSHRSRLLVLEDSGELMATDAKEQSGQGLSRLLNLSDGLLGLSTEVLILITTNEPLGRLHPAVHRPGRCLAEIEFLALDVDEACEWLAANGCDETVSSPKTLAQLYAIAAGRPDGARKEPVGFG